MYDVAIIGAGPSGIACGIEATRRGISHIIIEKGGIAENIRRFPIHMTFFSTPELLELGGLPFSTINVRPSRTEVLEYNLRVSKHFSLNFMLHTKAIRAERINDRFQIQTDRGEPIESRFLVIATGYFDKPQLLGIPGEDLPHVSHYYDEPFRYSGTRVVVVGGKNSAVETALELYRHGAQVTLVHRGANLNPNVKYWIRPDIENRLKTGAITAHFTSTVRLITSAAVQIDRQGISSEIPADFVFLHTGYRPDVPFLQNLGIRCNATSLIPTYSPETFLSNVDGVYLAGSVVGGRETGTVFIENGRMHAEPILRAIASQLT